MQPNQCNSHICRSSIRDNGVHQFRKTADFPSRQSASPFWQGKSHWGGNISSTNFDLAHAVWLSGGQGHGIHCFKGTFTIFVFILLTSWSGAALLKEFPGWNEMLLRIPKKTFSIIQNNLYTRVFVFISMKITIISNNIFHDFAGNRSPRSGC